MEQLESNPSVLRRKDSPDELPFPITDELIKLPGYRPKIPDEPSSKAPILPPKKSRQRRHSDSITSVTDSIATSSNFLDDPVVQERLRPRNNSVTNALYDR